MDNLMTMSPLSNVELSGGDVALACPICGGDRIQKKLEAPDRFHWRKEVHCLVRCTSCAAVWLASPPKPEEMGQHYTADYHNGITKAGEGSAVDRWRDQVTLISKHKTGGRLLDIGCSSGGFLSTMKGSAWRLYGVEMEESTAQRARSNSGAEVFVGDAEAAPFVPGSFDVITAFDVLEHVHSPRHFLIKVREWLKPGGIFYAMMPNIESWEARLFGSYWYGLELPRHLTLFSPNSLDRLMNSIGFEKVVLKTPPISYVERSLGYLFSSMLEKIGVTPIPQSKPVQHSVPFRAIRKGVRLTVFQPLAYAGSLAGLGPSLEVMFRKPGVNLKSNLSNPA